MSLTDALMGRVGKDYYTDYMRQREAEEAKKKPKKINMAKTRGGGTTSGHEANLALNDEYEAGN